MDSKEVVIDTNFFMVPFQFNVDIITELENKLPSYTLTTPSFVINQKFFIFHYLPLLNNTLTN
jgi:hypothetical protein